jgi:farnesyl-diphosphate farnesyltransferase
MSLKTDALEILKQTSRTFYISIVRLPQPLQNAVMSSYLALRAIDEIEDHPQLDKPTKIELLGAVSHEFQNHVDQRTNRFSVLLQVHEAQLPEVTNRLDEWINLAPVETVPRICDATGAMAQRMAYWVRKNWQIRTKRDLDRYTFGVAGSVGLLLSDLWVWYDGTQSSRRDAIGFGRGLQAVNILRNRSEDLGRDVDFFPDGWTEDDLAFYARHNLGRANSYVDSLPSGPVKEFCIAPLTLAYATLDALARGEPKLSRSVVLSLTKQNLPFHVVGSGGSVSHGTPKTDDGFNGRPSNGGRAIRSNISPRVCTAVTLNESEEVILVNEKDEVIGVEEKIKTHRLGALHRAFSVFIFNSMGQLLLQKRTSTKYHSQGLWSNTCCGHPRLGESTEQASRRRLREEMGFDCEVREVFQFLYRAKLEDGLIEHEYDHVLVGSFNDDPSPSPNEVDDWKWINLETLKLDIQENPEAYTCWFRIALDMLLPSLDVGWDVHPVQLALIRLIDPPQGSLAFEKKFHVKSSR